MIHFFLNRETSPRSLSPPAGMIVLEYLRDTGHVGCKEGCAAGDCGACSAVLAEVDGKSAKLRYSPINTCIAFMSALNGKLLVTVEGLADGDDALHPAQAALVREHGSQCGFCTPGFVMSLFAMTKRPPAEASAEAVADCLAGNLCRCTGYLPIIRAGLGLLNNPVVDYYDKNQNDIVRRLRAISGAVGNAGIADSEKTLAALRQKNPQSRLLGGGTDLALETTQQERPLGEAIDVSQVAEWRPIVDNGDHWRIGAAATIAEFAEFCAGALPAMTPFLRRFGSPPIRARATVGGNIGNASPIGDLPPPLIALDADIILGNGKTKRRLPLAEFFLDYKKTALAADEWISALVLPKPPDNAIFKVFKVSKRLEDDISAVCGAFYFLLDGDRVSLARLAFGGMAAIPKRAKRCEQAFLGRQWSAATAAEAAAMIGADFTPLTDMRAGAAYRLRAAAGVIRRAHLETEREIPRMEAIWA